jgi:hypothetical protein
LTIFRVHLCCYKMKNEYKIGVNSEKKDKSWMHPGKILKQ